MLLSPGSAPAPKQPKKSVSQTPSHAQLPNPTRMGWLYDMIGAHGASFEYSEPSRVWIRNRVSNSDVSSRRDRQQSVWWQHKPGSASPIYSPPQLKQPPLTTIDPTKPGLSMIHPQVKEAVLANMMAGHHGDSFSATSKPSTPLQSNGSIQPITSSSSPKFGTFSSSPYVPPISSLGTPPPDSSPRVRSRKSSNASTEMPLSLEEVLSTAALRSEFHQHLEEHFQHAHLDFLVAVEKWKDRAFGTRRMTIIPDDDEEEDTEDEDEDEQTRAATRAIKQQVKQASTQHQLRLALARKIYAQFMDDNKTDAIELRADIRRRVRQSLGLPDMEIAANIEEQKYAEAMGSGVEGQPHHNRDEKKSWFGGEGQSRVSSPVISDDALVITETLFDEAVGDVTIYLRDNLWPQFVESEEYQNMCEEKQQEDNDRREELLQQQNLARQQQAYMLQAAEQAEHYAQPPSNLSNPLQIQISLAESKTQHAQQAAAAMTNILNASAGVAPLGVNANADADDEEESAADLSILQQGQAIGATASKPPGWYNTDDYQSIHVDLVECRGIKVERKKMYCVVNVDSRNLKTRALIGGVWRDHLEFELLATTQYVEICVFTGGGTFLGLMAAPIAKIYTPIQTQPSWWKVNAGPHDKTQLELLVKFTLHKEPYRDTGHKQILEADESSNSTVADFVRNKVSKKKKRFQQDGFDLDMSYVTPRIIAMGYPSESLEGVYRNHMKDVQRFFTRRHPKAFKLYNLCSERSYNAEKFDNSVACYPFDDHNPPVFDVMKAACEDMRLWLADHPQNVVAIHCKAGKGRTGTMIAAYLCYCGAAADANAALQHFAEKRTKNKKGVTIPSQIRYVHYFDKYVRLKRAGLLSPGKTTLFLQGFTIHGIAEKAKGMETSIFFVIHNGNFKFDSYKAGIKPSHDKTTKKTIFDISKKLLPLSDDVRIEFVVKTTLGQQKLFQFWINTRWVELSYVDGSENPRLILGKMELDKACKDVKHKNYPQDFRLEITFSPSAIAPIKHAELSGQALPIHLAKHVTPSPTSPH